VQLALSYPLKLTFKLLTMVPQISIRDARGAEVMYAQWQLAKFGKGALDIDVFADRSKSKRLYALRPVTRADLSTMWTFTDMSGQNLGASLQRLHFGPMTEGKCQVYNGDQVEFRIHEKSRLAWTMDNLLRAIPFLGYLTGLVFNPTYLVRRNGMPSEEAPVLMRLVKEPSLLMRSFRIEKADGALRAPEEERLLLSLVALAMRYRPYG